MKTKEKFWISEIGIEFKAALYFYSIMFFYFGYKVICGTWQADIIILTEMVASTYIMSFVQVYLLGNFDESESITWREIIKAVCCSAVYVLISHILNWFDRELVVSGLFFVFVMLFYGCTYWLYNVKRSVSTRELNAELSEFKKKKEGALSDEDTGVWK